MVSAVHKHPCRQPSYTKQRQVLAEEKSVGACRVQVRRVVAPPTLCQGFTDNSLTNQLADKPTR